MVGPRPRPQTVATEVGGSETARPEAGGGQTGDAPPRSGPLERLRGAAGEALFARVAGEDGPEQRARIHGTPGPRDFPPGAAIRRVHDDASMFVGGFRALLLQALHPLAMAAVAEHSGYRTDPWGRLARTSTFLATTTFATSADAQQAIDIVRAVHVRMKGVAPVGRPYAADDPWLLRWVHIAEADSFLTAHQLYGRRPLDGAGCDEYLAQVATVAERLGAVDVPHDRVALRRAFTEFGPELRATRESEDVARYLISEPPLPWVAKGAYSLLGRAALASLPSWARRATPTPWYPRGSGRGDTATARAGGHAATKAIRWALAPTKSGTVETAPTPA
ncbi:histidine kinase [Paraoerskovia sediminicola]|uniref:Histidine kinase n=1 Tax=Paraoerskovia sediminicola TaxID=1138587 RepID=A0ABM8G3N3_9CELL|nr:oxygenase MpaB family protein [Paraoerskovia sediminicola]BDZ42762.1 histidine kinase [Paraoerskovia sediminicola]